jgi:arginase
MPSTYLISSQLGLLHLPQGKTERNLGVEDGPQAVVTPELAAELQLQTHVFSYSLPEQVSPDDYYHVFAQEAARSRDQIIEYTSEWPTHALKSIAVGGDHSVALAHVAALLQLVPHPEELGIVMMDSHADLNLRSTSPTGNIHGMWMRPVVDHFDVPELDALIPNKLPVENIMYVGNLDRDPAEKEYFDHYNVPVFSVEFLRQMQKEAVQLFSEWCSELSHLHLSIDIDGFDTSVAPATGIPCPAGFLLEDIVPLLKEVKKLPSWSLDLVEVNPRKAGAEHTVALAQELLRFLVK